MHKSCNLRVVCLTLILTVTFFMTFAVAIAATVMAAPGDQGPQALQNPHDEMQPMSYWHHRCERVRHHCHNRCDGHHNYYRCFRHCMQQNDCD